MSTTFASPKLRGAVAGDRGDVREFALTGVATLEGVTDISCAVWQHAGDAIPLTIEIIDAPTRMVRLNLGEAADDWLPALTGDSDWFGEVVTIWETDAELTFPDGDRSPFTIHVRASGPPEGEPTP